MSEEIRLVGVGKRFSRNARWVLRELDLSLAAGAFTAVSAANGAGKSTLLRIIAGLSLPTTGAVTGRPGTVGYVPERLPAALPMTARQYLTHMGRIRGLAPADAARRVAELVERLSVAPHPDAEMRTLSKGNTQKVAVAQAFLVHPALLVLDEPYTGLDPQARSGLDALIACACDEGSAVVLSAHELTAVPAGARVCRLVGGRLHEVSADRPAQRVVLEGPGLDPRPLTDRGDVELVSFDRERGWLTVRSTDATELLRAALAVGWSVVEVLR